MRVVVEVTNTLAAPFVTGYQRFVRETLCGLDDAGDVELIPVVWDEQLGYRRLDAGETARLRRQPDSLPAVVAPPASALRRARAQVAATPAGAAVRRAALRVVRRPSADHRALRLGPWEKGTIFLDLEPAWHDPRPRAQLLPELRAAGVEVVTVVADVLPVLHPEWFDARVGTLFRDWLTASLRSSSRFVAISHATRADLLAVAVAAGEAAPRVDVVPLGGDFAVPADEQAVALPTRAERYLLVVGTVEPRKNQALALDVLDTLATTHPDVGLVLVGKRGWLVDDLVARIEDHPAYGSRLLWLSGISDAQLAWLYRHAFLALAPSRAEGLGLPVQEALRYGVPTVASTAGALREAGGEVADYAEADDLPAWVELITRHLDDPAFHDQARTRVAGHRPPTWAESAAAVRAALADGADADGGRVSS